MISKALLFCFVLMTFAIPSWAAPKNVLLLASKQTPTYEHVIASLRLNLDSNKLILTTSFNPVQQTEEKLRSYDLIVSIGTLATEKALPAIEYTQVISTFIPRQTYQRLASRYPKNLTDNNLTGLYLEQPIERQLKLLNILAPDIKRLGTVFSQNSKESLQTLASASSRLKWALISAKLSLDDNPIEILTPVISAADAFLALPDRAVINQSTAKWILLMTFRQQIPLIAYSRSYVEAGALAAIFSTPELVGKETADWVTIWLADPQGTLPPPSYPEQFDLSINWGTAHSLGIEISSETALKEEILKP